MGPLKKSAGRGILFQKKASHPPYGGWNPGITNRFKGETKNHQFTDYAETNDSLICGICLTVGTA